MRESFSIETHKTIYERQGYPSSRGGFEKSFIEFLDMDGEVERFLKINESQHAFAVIYYMRKDGLMATYHPDFIVGTSGKIYLIETRLCCCHCFSEQMLFVFVSSVLLASFGQLNWNLSNTSSDLSKPLVNALA